MPDDSMSPLLREGEKVVCSFIEPSLWEQAIRDQYVYVVVGHMDVLVKRVENHLKGRKTLALRSDNSFYPDQELRLSDIREVWQARSKISHFTPVPPAAYDSMRQEMQDMRKSLEVQHDLILGLRETIQNLKG
jgi:Peptidase S24-like